MTAIHNFLHLITQSSTWDAITIAVLAVVVVILFGPHLLKVDDESALWFEIFSKIHRGKSAFDDAEDDDSHKRPPSA